MFRPLLKQTLLSGAFFLAMTATAVPASGKVDILDIASPAFKVFTDQNGLPSNAVMTLDRDAQGRFWVGTQDGAAYFNGHHWIVVNMPDRNISNYIFDILHGSDGSVWFATDGNGVHRLLGGTWTSFGPANGLASNFARVLLEAEDGSVWAGTRDGLFRFEGVGWSRFDLGDDPARSRIRSLINTMRDDQETIWVGTYGGLIAISNNSTKVYTVKNGMPHDTVFALFDSFQFDGTDRILVGTDRGLVAISDGRVERTVGPEQLSKEIRSITTSKTFGGKNKLWIGTGSNGLLAYENGRWSVFDQKRGLPGDTVFAVFDANIGDGSIWVSTLGHGVARLERGNWHQVNESHGLSKRVVFSSIESGGAYWFATFGGGIARFDGTGWTTFSEADGRLPDDYVYSLNSVVVEGNEQIFGGGETGAVSYSGGRWAPFGWPELQTEAWDFQSSRANNETLFVGTSRGLVEMSGGTSTVTNSQNGLPDDRVRAIAETKSPEGKTTLWVGTYGGGLARRADGEWSTIDINSGLPSNRVLALLEYPIAGRQKLLVATSGGIAGVDLEDTNEPIIVFNPDNTPGMLNGYVLDLIADRKGRLYALTNRGVSRFTPVGDATGALDVYTFTTEDGLPSNECVSGSAFLDSAGRLFVGTVEGLAILDLENELNNIEAKPLLLENISVAGNIRNNLAGSELSYSDSNLKFNFSLVSDFREHATKYRTQLIGFENEPTEWSDEPEREFSYLPAGSYKFQVWARDHFGNISIAPAIPFTVRPAWWQTWWAMLLYLLVVVSIVSLIAFVIYRNRLNRILEIERVRSRIATDLHDDIGASLSQIAILSEVMSQKLQKGTDVGTKPLATIAETSRDLMNSMSDIVWSINPKRDHLVDLVQRMRRFATEVLTAKEIEFDFEAPEDDLGGRLDLNTRRQIYLIFKEAVNNCVKHSGCSRVLVLVRRSGSGFEMTISDNGSGFSPDADNTGNGLTSMRQRAESIGGNLEISPNRNEIGTEVSLSVRINSRFRFGK